MKCATMFVIILLVALLSPVAATAQMTEVGLNDGEQGRLIFKSSDGPERYLQAPILKTEVKMNITGLVARVKVQQHFTNPSNQWLNGIYTFPLPELSAVDRLSMRIGERVIKGVIQEKQQARQTYQKAKQAGKKASLVEQKRPNMFTNNVANIGPGETVIVEIEYQQTLRYDQGQFSIRFPMVVAPRYIPGNKVITGFKGDGWAHNTDKVPDASEITPVIKADDVTNPHEVSIKIRLDSGVPLASVTSDYHTVRVNELSDHEYEIELENNKVLANRDFVLSWQSESHQQPQGAFFSQQVGDENYALLMVLPPYEKQDRSGLLPREMVFVIDTSGSMHGESLRQAKQALAAGLERLKPHDRFNVVQFNSYGSMLFSASEAASPSNVEHAKRYVYGLVAEGGTNIDDALDMVLQGQQENSMVRQVVFVTDGSVGNEEALFDKIKAQLGANRLFTVGIGSAPNSRFMRGAATMGRGTFTYIGSIDLVREKMTELFLKLENPILRDVKIQDGSGKHLSAKVDYWPNPINDLYLGEPVLVSLKLPNDIDNLSLTGKLAGQDWYLDLPVSSGGHEEGLDVLWARNKIRSLSESARNAKERIHIEQAITELGLKHHLVTRYTSLVAVDVTPTKPVGETSADQSMKNHLPAGWTQHKPHGQLPQGATSAQFNLLMGLLLALMAFIWQYATRLRVVR